MFPPDQPPPMPWPPPNWLTSALGQGGPVPDLSQALAGQEPQPGLIEGLAPPAGPGLDLGQVFGASLANGPGLAVEQARQAHEGVAGPIAPVGTEQLGVEPVRGEAAGVPTPGPQPPATFEQELFGPQGLREQQLGAMQQQGDLESARAAELATGMTEAAEADRARLEAREAQEKENVALADQEMAAYEAERSGLAKEKINTDPLTTGQKFAGIIAAAISGYLNPRGPNSAVALIGDVIARNIEAQKADMANRRELAGQRQSIFRTNLERWGDEQSATIATGIAYKQQGLDDLRAKDAQYASPIAHYEHAQQELAFREDIATDKEVLRQRRIAMHRQAAASAAATRAKAEADARKREIEDRNYLLEVRKVDATADKETRGRIFRDETGEALGMAGTEEVAKRLNQSTGHTTSLVRLLDEAIDLRTTLDQSPSLRGSPAYRKLAQGKAAAIALAVKKGEELGALDKGVEVITNRLVGDPLSFFSTAGQIEQLKISSLRSQDTQLRTEGGYKGPPWVPKFQEDSFEKGDLVDPVGVEPLEGSRLTPFGEEIGIIPFARSRGVEVDGR